VSAITHALRLAAQGLKLFPLSAGSKRPPLISDWEAGASSDPAVLTAWADKHLGCNFGIACGPSGLLVLDVDVKRTKAGMASLCALELDNGDLDCLKVTSPTGGLHLYLRGQAQSSVERVGPGLDVRSDGGYVVAPGATVDGKPYAYANEKPIGAAPEWLLGLAGKPLRRAEATLPACELDTPSAMARAASWLAQAEPAVQGNGGDALTLKTAMRVKDLGISEAACLELMASWNSLCSPPWSAEELANKVKNAYAYGSSPPGCDSPEAAFAGVEPPAVEHGLSTPADTPEEMRNVHCAAGLDFATIPRREWLLGFRFVPGFVTLTISPGGVGKSTLSLHEAVALASGRGSLCGLPDVTPQQVWVHNTEDPIDEISRRVAAACMAHGIYGDARARLHFSSGRDEPVVLVANQGKGPVVNNKRIEQMMRFVDKNKVKLVVLDPFVRLHRCDENDNNSIDLVVQALSKIAGKTGCAMHVIHHTRKRSQGQGGEGDMDTARGASALASAARIAHTLCGMSEKFAKEYGIPDAERKMLVRLDDAKANMSPPASDVTWFRKIGVDLPNGDKVGALKLFVLPPKITKTGGDTQDIDSSADERKAAKAEKRTKRSAAPGGIRGF